ncbi:Zinc finger RING-type [Arabidopsis thaliana x Arabidopsis arenosa]|uniref:RING-type E3 ubiquitin transferase n=1 Tax=Arabidopsis thaliana x Arabidopsis arenosa TaxID=1240361 RepID=A0A8T1XFN1_9BRAS|nr:Zinc finger RING-type [Arabidopsis thaliana x Arabidopsis arenosa]
MDQSNRHNPLRDLRFSPPPPPPPIFHHVSSTGTSFPILAVAVIGILATAFLLVSYYVFVIKCCLNWHRIDILRRFSLSRRRRNDQDPLMVYSPEIRNRGLEESVIRAIPIFKFKKRNDQNDGVFTGEGEGEEEKSSQECSVCLSEFQDEEKLRIIPNCCHLFHIDCIDVWLQNNANCPLCRARVSCDTSFPPDRVSAPSSSPENPFVGSGTVVLRGENEYVVIELGNSIGSDRDSPRSGRLLMEQERSNSGHLLTTNTQNSISTSPKKLDRGGLPRKPRKLHKMTSMGDECIDIRRGIDEQFGSIQPIRRSISMDSSADRQLYLAVQEAIRKNREVPVVGDGGGCSNSSSGNVSNSKVKRSFFSFGSSRRSRSSSILPLYFEP